MSENELGRIYDLVTGEREKRYARRVKRHEPMTRREAEELSLEAATGIATWVDGFLLGERVKVGEVSEEFVAQVGRAVLAHLEREGALERG